MDAYNIAVCFGPTLLPVPDTYDQVTAQANVNEIVKVSRAGYDLKQFTILSLIIDRFLDDRHEPRSDIHRRYGRTSLRESDGI